MNRIKNLIGGPNQQYCRKRNRTQNWTEAEKWFLLHQVASNHNAIANKDNDMVSAQQRAQAWDQIMDEYNLAFGTSRNLIRVKEQWKRMKISARQETKDPRLQQSEMTTYVKDLLAAVNKRSNPFYEGTGITQAPVSVSEHAMIPPTLIKIEALDPDTQSFHLTRHTEAQEPINNTQPIQPDVTATTDSQAHSQMMERKVILEQPTPVTQSKMTADTEDNNQSVNSNMHQELIKNTLEVINHLNETVDDKDKSENSSEKTSTAPFPVCILINPQSVPSNTHVDKLHDSPKRKKYKTAKAPHAILPRQSPTVSPATSTGGQSPVCLQMQPITFTTPSSPATTFPITTTFTKSSTPVSNTSRQNSTKPEDTRHETVLKTFENSETIGENLPNAASEAATSGRSRVSALLCLKQQLLQDSITYALEEHALRKRCIEEEHQKKMELLELEKQTAMAKLYVHQARLNIILADTDLNGQV